MFVFQVSVQLSNLIRYAADTAMQMNPVERVQFYEKLDRFESNDHTWSNQFIKGLLCTYAWSAFEFV